MSSESRRTRASQQYFELRNNLNHANRTKNLKTELEFEIRENEDEYFIIIKSTGAEHGLRLAYKVKASTGRWILFENERFSVFFKYMYSCIFNLPDNTKKTDINKLLTGWLFQLWVV